MDEEPSSLAAVAERLSSEDYIIQEWMVPLQHPDIARFREGVINTMRLVTFDTGDGRERGRRVAANGDLISRASTVGRRAASLRRST